MIKHDKAEYGKAIISTLSKELTQEYGSGYSQRNLFKLGEFLPEHKGQVELYLRWLEKNEMAEGEETPIGLILCARKTA